MSCVTSLSEAKRKLMETYRRGNTTAAVAPVSSIVPRPVGSPVPLSLSQEQLVLREVNTPGIFPLYNECITVRISEPLDVPALEKSILTIISRHEIWRTSYDLSTGRPLQVIHPAPEQISLNTIDLRSVPAAMQEAAAYEAIAPLVRESFDLQNGPLLRFRLVKLGEFEHKLILIAHLSIVDGVSAYQIWPSELAALYRAYSAGRPSPLAEQRIQFGDYAHWQRSRLADEEMAMQVAYWRQRLARLPVLNFPRSRAQAATNTFPGGISSFAFPSALSKAVKELSRQEGVTLFVTLLSVFATLLFAHTGQEDLVIGTPSPAGRKSSDVAGLLGYFLNPVALRFDLNGNPAFRSLLRQAQRFTLEAIANDDVPIEWLARELQSESETRRNPFLPIAMSLQPAMPDVGLDWSVTSMDVQSGGSPWDLYFAFIDTPEGIQGRVQYNSDLFDKNTIARLWQHFQQLLEFFTADTGKRLADTKGLLEDKVSLA